MKTQLLNILTDWHSASLLMKFGMAFCLIWLTVSLVVGLVTLFTKDPGHPGKGYK